MYSALVRMEKAYNQKAFAPVPISTMSEKSVLLCAPLKSKEIWIEVDK